MAVAVSRWRRVARWLFRAAALWLAVTVGAVVLLRFVDPPTTAFMLERRLDARDEKRKTPYVSHFHYVPLSAISPQLQRAVMAAEDQKFSKHHGFDFDAIGSALEGHLENRTARGASTLTQQVAKNLFLWPARSYVRKAIEAYLAVLLEVFWPKWRILEMHLNIAEYGDGVYGADAASRAFFHKPPSQLTALEAAKLATVLPAPRRRNAGALSAAMSARAEQIAETAREMSPDPVQLINER